jgi:phage shock protein A
LNRVTDILSANLSDLVESYEDPELLLKQAVGKMEESIRAAMGHAVKVVTHEKILARQLADEESAVTFWRQRAEFPKSMPATTTTSVRRGEDNLARDALRQKSCHEGLCESLAMQLGEAALARRPPARGSCSPTIA